MGNLTFGLYVTVIGMGLVFALLTLLWGLLSLVARFESVAGSAAETERADGEALADAPAAAAPGLTADMLAAVSIAVISHVTARRRQAAPETRTAWPGSQMYASRWLASGRTRQTRSWTPKR